MKDELNGFIQSIHVKWSFLDISDLDFSAVPRPELSAKSSTEDRAKLCQASGDLSDFTQAFIHHPLSLLPC